jgi:Ca-activated chloride channel family protein
METLRAGFANLWALWLLTVLPVLACFAVWSWLRKRRALGRWSLLAARGKRRGWSGLCRFCVTLGIVALVLGIAGPRWGADLTPTGAPGRDLVVVLDVSRSMLAEQPARQTLAKDMLADLARKLEQRGGHRLGLVVFAAHARLVCPLTHDYDYFLDSVTQQDADNLPRAFRPTKDGPVSGTRMGAGLRLAVLAHDPAAAGHQDILLISDGVDPLNDNEWLEGVSLAHKHGIAIHVVGVGDPLVPHTVALPKAPREETSPTVATKLQETRLEEIARRTQGAYYPARTQRLAPDTLYRDILQAQPALEDRNGASPGLQQQYRWFLTAALALLALAMLLAVDKKPYQSVGWASPTKEPARRASPTREPPHVARNRPIPAALLVPLAVLLVSAAPLLDVEDLIQNGNNAFARQEYEEALKFYEQAEERATDPGLVAFNKGAALYRLKRYREAELSYLRALEDRAAPSTRQARALFDLGTSLLQTDPVRDAVDALERAMDCFDRCRRHPSADAALKADAIHNLELARLLYNQAKQEAAQNKKPPPPDHDKTQANDKHKGPDKTADKSLKKGDGTTKDGDGKNGTAVEGDPTKGDASDKKLASSLLDSLPNESKRVPISRDDVERLLAEQVRRIDRARRAHRNPPPVAGAGVKDW